MFVNLGKHELYDKEPVYYCKRCGSLAILYIDEEDYCDKCNNTDIGKVSILNWVEFIKNERNGKENGSC